MEQAENKDTELNILKNKNKNLIHKYTKVWEATESLLISS